MNNKQLKYALALATEGSFSRAAEALNISQPSLSQYIKKIEQELGVTLFDRTGGYVRLTDAGRVYIEAGRKILDIERQMENRFSDIRDQKVGTLVIGTSPFRSAGMMPTVAAEFRKRYPGICLCISERDTASLMDGMEHGEFDLCITPLPVDERLYTYEKLMEEELILAVPSEYADRFEATAREGRKYPAIDASAIDGLPFVMITDTQIMQIALNNLCADFGLQLQRAAVVKSLEAQIMMVREGVGLALVPAGIEKFNPHDTSISYFSFQQELPRREIAAVYRKEQTISAIARELIDTVKEIKW